jgi:hypothetical protein
MVEVCSYIPFAKVATIGLTPMVLAVTPFVSNNENACK